MWQVTTLLRACLFAVSLLLVPALPLISDAFGQSSQSPTTSAPERVAPAQPSKSFMPPRGGASKEAAPAPPTGLWAGFYFWTADKQRQFISTLAASLRDIKTGNVIGASFVLIGFSFLYGILHAAGPGHGKAIVSSYILADGQTVRRGVQLAFLSAAVQAVSAIAIFAVAVFALKGARAQVVSTEAFLERMSWLIVALFGAWLLFRQLRALWTGTTDHDHAHHGHAHHGHAHHGPHDHKHHEQGQSHKNHDHHAHSPQGHAHASGEVCETCGHAHMPTAEALQGAWSWRRAATMALAIGIRPCTGAIGVLFVANGLGLMWAGVLSTFAMAVGTAITVSALAALAATSRDGASRLAGVADNRFAQHAQTAFGLIGAALVFFLGASFFYYSLGTSQPF